MTIIDTYAAAADGPAIDLDGIRRMLDSAKICNRHDLLTIAILALMEDGVNTGPRIIAAAQTLGFYREHAGAVLANNAGTDPKRFRWWRNPDGIYQAHAT